MLQGVVVKAYNSYYYVQTNGRIIPCKLRGRFKKEKFSLIVGDEVEYSKIDDLNGVIENILPRRSLLRRPMIANVDQAILVFAARNPDINTALVDRFLILTELPQLETIICINKIDICDIDEINAIAEIYRNVGYKVLLLSAINSLHIDTLRSLLVGKVNVFAGPSGAGKSTILNAIEPGLELMTGEVSRKIGRGKHTTRYAELLPLSGGGFIVDTPGFSSTEFVDLEPQDLMYCFPDIVRHASGCKFKTCLHYKEPQCAVKESVDKGKIYPQRYLSYLQILEEILKNKKGY